MAVAPYRLVWLALWVEASPAEDAALAEHFRAALAPHGEVVVHPRGPLRRTPAMLHFEIDLTPRGSTSDCLRALGFARDEGRDRNEWERPVDGGVFLHPAVYGVRAGEVEAAAAPRFETGDVVRVRDSRTARALGLVGTEVIVGHPEHDGDAEPARRTWRYSVNIEGRDETEDLAEGELEPTGRRVRLYGERLGVTPDGVAVGGPSGASGTPDGS